MHSKSAIAVFVCADLLNILVLTYILNCKLIKYKLVLALCIEWSALNDSGGSQIYLEVALEAMASVLKDVTSATNSGRRFGKITEVIRIPEACGPQPETGEGGFSQAVQELTRKDSEVHLCKPGHSTCSH